MDLMELNYKKAVEAKGKYKYISGYKEKRVLVKHIRCGNILEMSIPGALVDTKRDLCKECRVDSYSKYYKPVKREKLHQKPLTEIERYVDREAQKLIETMKSEGYLFGEDLREFVRLSVVSDKFGLSKFNEKDLIDTYLKMIIKKYKYHAVGICKRCGKIHKSVKDWGSRDRYNNRICFRCARKK